MFTTIKLPTELEQLEEVVAGHRQGVLEAQQALIQAQARLVAAQELQLARRLGTGLPTLTQPRTSATKAGRTLPT